MDKEEIQRKSIELHKKNKGKVAIASKVALKTREDLTLAYTPGVAEVSRIVAENKANAYDYTMKSNSVAVITDGSAVLGLGNIGPEASLPVMEGKAILFKEFAGIDAFPIALNTQDTKEIIQTVKNVAPAFGGINLEDISAPRCFEIEKQLQDIGIPVFHDDQHGTAIAILAALINASKVVEKDLDNMKIVISGAGAAGTGISKLLLCVGIDKKICTTVKDIVVCDSKGVISKNRKDLDINKQEMAKYTNKKGVDGSLTEAMKDADAFIGVSTGGIVSKEMIQSMADKSIVFSMANPVPEIMPNESKEAGAYIIGTGRSDFPNQINNVLAFPGVFRGALDAKATRITDKMKIYAAHALAETIKTPTREKITPDVFDKQLVRNISEAVKKAA
jgi:malate dehydrogenase (oxaloacetate-decarboxylating)